MSAYRMLTDLARQLYTRQLVQLSLNEAKTKGERIGLSTEKALTAYFGRLSDEGLYKTAYDSGLVY